MSELTNSRQGTKADDRLRKMGSPPRSNFGTQPQQKTLPGASGSTPPGCETPAGVVRPSNRGLMNDNQPARGRAKP